MPQEYKDATYSLNTGIEGQITPPIYASPGVLTSTTAVAGTYIATSGTPQLTTQVNPTLTIVTGQSNAMAEQVLAVVGQVYNSPGGILNKAQNNGSTVTTGGGP